MSWLSALYQRNKHVIASAVSVVPGVGGILAKGVESINTGDYRNVQPSASVAQQQAQINALAQQQVDAARQAAANATAQAGVQAAAAIGPPGNPYQRFLQIFGGNPMAAIGAVIAIMLLLYLVIRKRK